MEVQGSPKGKGVEQVDFQEFEPLELTLLDKPLDLSLLGKLCDASLAREDGGIGYVGSGGGFSNSIRPVRSNGLAAEVEPENNLLDVTKAVVQAKEVGIVNSHIRFRMEDSDLSKFSDSVGDIGKELERKAWQKVKRKQKKKLIKGNSLSLSVTSFPYLEDSKGRGKKSSKVPLPLFKREQLRLLSVGKRRVKRMVTRLKIVGCRGRFLHLLRVLNLCLK